MRETWFQLFWAATQTWGRWSVVVHAMWLKSWIEIWWAWPGSCCHGAAALARRKSWPAELTHATEPSSPAEIWVAAPSLICQLLAWTSHWKIWAWLLVHQMLKRPPAEMVFTPDPWTCFQLFVAWSQKCGRPSPVVQTTVPSEAAEIHEMPEPC